ncbi:FadR family transcriptional regulator [Desulfobulbus rhabdoformis]|jgi:GntR family transcriptional repressor for pyruvate dehydrogenase complex|uniref:FadR/GntR family transcriptional regulator n=1 Tax=Desulfobulbus rhabdoformis TaxID=34032 RepID=UPI001966CDA8|nr:FadR/GntR family transcriptional regulator [Desulfobulbus rhabdoformis]MBM9615217.1 FadR family transcriptional regulator [Desulfobulbus rhabdoformis]
MDNKRHDEIVSQIEGLIKNGQLKAGERLPAERFLAEKFQVSRNTVREAIKALAESGIVASRRGSGTFVAEGALRHIVEGASRQRTRLNEIFELRKIFEPQIAALAAKRITREQLAELGQVLEEQAKAKESGVNEVELDERFHHLIAQATGNRALLDLYETLSGILGESRISELQSKERYLNSIDNHKKILKALSCQSEKEAAQCMRRHMDQVEQNLDNLT